MYWPLSASVSAILVLRVWNAAAPELVRVGRGQRHHSHQASVRSGSGFGLRQAPPLALSVVPTIGLPLTTGADVTATGLPVCCACRGTAAEGEHERNGHPGRPVPPPRADQ